MRTPATRLAGFAALLVAAFAIAVVVGGAIEPHATGGGAGNVPSGGHGGHAEFTQEVAL
jgi:hypothetical protein